MRLWHQALIPRLPHQQLLGQHSEICGLRGNGWGKKHSTVNYVFRYSPYALYAYHAHVMIEMRVRGYQVDPKWLYPSYRGLRCEPWPSMDYVLPNIFNHVYHEHDDTYLAECIDNLRCKGVILSAILSTPE